MDKKSSGSSKAIVCVFMVIVIGLIIFTLLNPMSAGEGYESKFYSTPLGLVPPLIAIILALITKEVYSSLFLDNESLCTSDVTSDSFLSHLLRRT